MKTKHQHKNSGLKNSHAIRSAILFATIVLALSQAWAISNLSADRYFGAPDAIMRSFSSTSIAAGSDVTVTLTISPGNGHTYYAIDEMIPRGWTVKDAGTGSTLHAGHIKWVVIQEAARTTYSYVLTSPASAGKGIFNGIYMFEGDTKEQIIKGQHIVTVR